MNRKMFPQTLKTNHLRAWLLGIRDGWNQPYSVSSSYNTDHLYREGDSIDIHDTLDRGINFGQVLRSPINHERL